jgi:hypothetical protein
LSSTALWLKEGRDEESKKYDSEFKEKEMDEIRKTIKSVKQIYGDLPETY